jgi:hypothetical protein
MALSRTWSARTTGMTMAQFDVFVNPVPAARTAFPFVVAMQSDFANTPKEQLVAPVAARNSLASIGRLTPRVAIRGAEHVVFVPRMRVMQSRDLAATVDSVAAARGELLAAVDLLLFGL